jgi:transcriptional regulator with XRE-family HTH domain
MQKMSLKAARANANLTQKDVAKELGVDVSTVRNWECGRTFPKQPMIEKLCTLYGTSYDFIKFF